MGQKEGYTIYIIVRSVPHTSPNIRSAFGDAWLFLRPRVVFSCFSFFREDKRRMATRKRYVGGVRSVAAICIVLIFSGLPLLWLFPLLIVFLPSSTWVQF